MTTLANLFRRPAGGRRGGGRYDLVVVGLGSAGMVAAPFAARLGLRVAAVERGRVGGDCLWTGCVPSKSLIASAAVAQRARAAANYGVHVEGVAVDLPAVWRRVRRIQEEIAATDDSSERVTAAGVEVVAGSARLDAPDRVEVDGPDGSRSLATRYVLLCTGSRPTVPAIPGLAEVGYLTSETAWELEVPPAAVIVIGGGPVGVELAQAFARLGITTTLLQRGDRILPRDEPGLAARLAGVLRREGVELVCGVDIDAVTALDGRKVVHGRRAGTRASWAAEELFMAVGRTANADGLGLEALGVEVHEAGVEVDERQRTASSPVYAVGDLTGRTRFTHAAGYQGVRAVRDMFFPGHGRADAPIPWATYTDPELAHSGLTEAQARAKHGDTVEVHVHDLRHNDRARAEGAVDGVIVLVTVKRRLIGASVLAPSAGEVIGELHHAVTRRLDLDDLASIVRPYPTISTGVSLLAGEEAFRRADKYRWLLRRR